MAWASHTFDNKLQLLLECDAWHMFFLYVSEKQREFLNISNRNPTQAMNAQENPKILQAYPHIIFHLCIE